ncbi:MAG TPA: DUF58 domain-containing protein [Solirubrobacteraceae bacterium]|nr:DUF58 domain-containing protein [Solirubrobacteraceae bacterium]
MTPTTRCAWLLATVAVVALALPAWAALAVAALLLAAMLADGLSVRVAPRIERAVEQVLSRGVAAPLRIDALAPDARRVLLRQPATPALEVRAHGGAHELRGEIVPVLRGRQRLPGVAGASVGPLGLARWHHPAGAAAELLVYPNLVGARRLALRLREGRAAPVGRLRRGPLGLGTEFESIREYSPDDDIRQVNWRASARLGRPMSNQYRVEHDHDVLCLLDAGRLMAAASERGTLLDATLDAATAVALAADELGDRCGAIAFDADVRLSVQPRRLGGRRVVHALFDLQPTLEDSDFERAFLRVGGSRRGLVLVFTDLVDEYAARSLVRAAPMLTRRHAVVVASVGDPVLEDAALERHEDEARALAALSVLRARDSAVTRIRRAGADVVLAPARSLPVRCVQAYLRAKARVRM